MQESVSGSWHIPKSGGEDVSAPVKWLCVTRTGQPNPEILKVEEKLNHLLAGAGETGPDSKPVEEANSELKQT